MTKKHTEAIRSHAKRNLFAVIITVLLLEAVIFIGLRVKLALAQSAPDATVQTASAEPIASTILANGTVTAQNQVTLHFQTAGKLTYLPFKQGDRISNGQTIAQIDTYALQQQLQLAANTYETTKNITAQTLENQQAGVLEGQQRTSLDTTNHNSYSTITENTIIYDAVKRMVDNSLLAQNSAQLSVNLANYAIQLATLTSPLSGIVTQEDITVSGVNITPATGFTVADPTSLVFRVDVPVDEIDYISVGNPATIKLDGQNRNTQATVTKVYPAKTILADGEAVYQVDIQSNQNQPLGKLDQSGTALIQTTTQPNVLLVPAWTVLGSKYIWVKQNNIPVLKTITIGRTHNAMIEVTGGLSAGDQIITDPQFLAKQKYSLL